jgi:asparagine synthase (glutamine-hydrolysing)
MCGIAGILYHDALRPAAGELLGRMNAALAHRGPDDAGVYCSGPLGLAHRRLSIIDLSPAGRQPMGNEDGTVWIVFNGEIYNFQSLRPALEAAGHRFQSRTDTEVVLHLYEAYGPECVQQLRGMFAFAIWDAPRRRLVLARDRVGKKPLCYQQDATAFRFASEVKAILHDPEVAVQIDPAGVAAYLTYGYVPAPGSAFLGVRHLPPAHYLLYEHGRTELVRYWRLRQDRKVRRSEAEWCEGLRATLGEAVRTRLISDVPLGAFLSGGIDSSAVVAMMSQASAAPVKTFSIGFDEPEYSELGYARQIAELFGTEHHELIVRPDALAVLPCLAWQYDEPFADSSAVPTFYLAEMARRHVTVALTGDGGDETFAGYDRYLARRLAASLDGVPGAAIGRRALRALVSALPRGGRRTSVLTRGRRLLEGMAESPERRYARWFCYFHGERRAALCRPEFLRAAGETDELACLLETYRESDAADPGDATLALDTALYLPGDLLVKMDMASMSHGLEARSPLLDHEVMEFAATMPFDLKLRGRIKKYILKEALHDLLPAAILARPKMGFGVPIDHWLRHEVREYAAEVLLGARARGRGYFRMDAVGRLFDEHVAGRANWHYLLWNLLMLELWHRTYLDGDGELARRRAKAAGDGNGVTG